MKRFILRFCIWAFLALVICVTVIALGSDYQKTLSLISSISPEYLSLIIISVLFNYALRFLKWQYYLKLLKICISLKLSLWVFFSAFTMVLSPGKLGELVKSLLLKSRADISVAETAPIVMAERVTDLLGMLLLCVIGFSQTSFGGRPILIVGALIITGTYAITTEWFWNLVIRLANRIKALEKLKDTFTMLQKSTQNLLSLKALAVTVPLSTLSWAGEGVALYLIFRSMGIDQPGLLGLSIFAHAFSSIAGAVSFLPGGLLITEGAMGALFIYAQIPNEPAVSATFIIRAVTLWFAVLLGTIIFAIGHQAKDLEDLKNI